MKKGNHIFTLEEHPPANSSEVTIGAHEHLKNEKLHQKNSSYIEISLYKDIQTCICKPLFLLRTALFLYYGSGAFAFPYISLIFKQRGVTLLEVSAIIICVPFVEYVGTLLSGVVSDKIGRAKSVLLTNVSLTTAAVLVIALLPSLNINCHSIGIECQNNYSNDAVLRNICSELFKLMGSNCSERYFVLINTTEIQVDLELKSKNTSENTRLSVSVNGTYNYGGKYYYKGNNKLMNGSINSWCTEKLNKNHTIVCDNNMLSNHQRDYISYSRNSVLIAHGVMFVVFTTVFTCSFRCFDTTTVCLEEAHGSNFGHEQFFAILGNCLLPLLSGAVVTIFKTYLAGLHLYVILNSILLLTLLKLPVSMNRPCKEIRKTPCKFLCNVEFLVFDLVLLALGTGFNIKESYEFWYLADLKASGMLISLIPSISSLIGLPFLFASERIIRKIRRCPVFVLGLLAFFGGLSYIVNPWLSLLLQLTSPFTYFFLWVAVMEHSYKMAPDGWTATVVTGCGGIHFTIAEILTGVFGSTLMNIFEPKFAFRILAAVFLALAILFGGLFYALNKKERGKLYDDKVIGKKVGKDRENCSPEDNCSSNRNSSK